MGIGGEGGEGEFGGVDFLGVSSHRVRPVPASNPTSLHSHIQSLVSMGESDATPATIPLQNATSHRTRNNIQGLENTHGILFTICSCSPLPFPILPHSSVASLSAFGPKPVLFSIPPDEQPPSRFRSHALLPEPTCWSAVCAACSASLPAWRPWRCRCRVAQRARDRRCTS